MFYLNSKTMDNASAAFYRHFYSRTNGYIPAKPLNSVMYPGDFFQIRNGEIIVLGNIYRDNVITPADVSLDYNIKLNPAGWSFNDGVSKPYSGRGSGNDTIGGGEFEFSKQILGFARRGSFIFHADTPEAARIVNWDELKQALIIRLTQTMYSFRELYVVSESITAHNWSLAIAGSENAEMEIASEQDTYTLSDIFGHHNTKTIQTRDIDFFHREQGRKPNFFRAKKLAVQDEKTEVFISDLINRRMQQNDWAAGFYNFNNESSAAFIPHPPSYSQANVLDMLAANELNPNTALNYFRWADATLDDVEKLIR